MIMEVEDLLSGLSTLLNRLLTRWDCHHEEQMAELTKIGNELQFICEELEIINGAKARESEDLMAGVL